MSEKFDLRTHIRDSKSGRVSRVQHYNMSAGPDGTFFERPPGSGIWYNADGSLTEKSKKLLEEQEKAKELRQQVEARVQAELAKEAAKVAEPPKAVKPLEVKPADKGAK